MSHKVKPQVSNRNVILTMRFPVALVIMYAGSAAFAAALTVPGKEREQLRTKDYLAFAAAQGIDLSKIPAWEPVAALNFTPIITGDGLPTLQELNLTWADIMKPAILGGSTAKPHSR
ncbi:hypothetical protein D9611_012855 [Ephemerocybe angulata]|uniref:Uncharacterized protein n=1 Tax=Ephemerocybe angulata TaxID=980116 RepID=A0A8H5BCR1_9AGAR|nr:hypothetical protein D9611_012855 [Tulosesus angulatus]